ncbi:Membrane proteins related to metalloendopeptidases [Prauserella aidingensis]|uniref:peptidoglycan-binding protein n=1 Tax=Prauserella aidingensis TaxID=387890 RepID=UPI0020A35FB1|nr:peptidoglycan-binding protein [Prauserella aidingensis]MCP2256183.1 Membrane proteins related to metalloendopeptidases [Prauserella aidingensis]
MCEQCGAPDDRLGTDAAERRGLSRRAMLSGTAVGAGALALGLLGATGTASAASLKNGAWRNPALGYFPRGGHFGADRGGVPHAGQDVTNSTGTAVYAAATGRAWSVGWGVLSGRTGRGIIMSHGNGVYTYYGHLSRFRVSEGAWVTAGEWIGDMGTTGNVTGPHLHFETHTGGLHGIVNPVSFMRARGVDLGGGWSSIDPGADGEVVKTIQYLMRYRGTNLVIDGDYGPISVSAVKSFQSSQGLYVDGQVGPKTWPHLVATARSGRNGNHVKAAQTALNIRSAGLLVDGDCGPVTVSAIRSFQSVNRLVVDGVCGPVTWRALVG